MKNNDPLVKWLTANRKYGMPEKSHPDGIDAACRENHEFSSKVDGTPFEEFKGKSQAVFKELYQKYFWMRSYPALKAEQTLFNNILMVLLHEHCSDSGLPMKTG